MKNINEALDYIYSFMGKKTLHKNNLNHINNVKEILKLLGYKQVFKVIHITGTKGKGSVTLTLSKMLSSLGYKAGAFTSPHIVNERERISINEEWISEEDFINITKKIKNIIDNNEIYSNVTVFEIFIALVFPASTTLALAKMFSISLIACALIYPQQLCIQKPAHQVF